MRFATPIIAALATTAFAYNTKRDTSDAISSLDTASADAVSALTSAQTSLDSVSTTGSLATAVSSIQSTISEGITSLESISSSGDSSDDIGTYGAALQTELNSLLTSFATEQTELASGEFDSPISVNDIDDILDALVEDGGISAAFNEIADLLESLDLPSLPVAK